MGLWTGAENLAPPGFDPRTVQPVGSRYTDYATRPTVFILTTIVLISGRSLVTLKQSNALSDTRKH